MAHIKNWSSVDLRTSNPSAYAYARKLRAQWIRRQPPWEASAYRVKHNTTKCRRRIHAPSWNKTRDSTALQIAVIGSVLSSSVMLCFTKMKPVTEVLRSDDGEVISLSATISDRPFQYWDYTASEGKTTVKGLKKTQKYLNQRHRSPDRDSNRIPPE